MADEQKPGIYRRMRRVLNAGDSTWGVVGATVVLAAGVSLVEFSCTAGFPVLWTNLLITQQATALTFGLLLPLYILIYQLDELAIFLVAVFTLKATKLEEKQGRILKLIGGMLMLTLAAVMLINPAWMNQLSSSLIVFWHCLCRHSLGAPGAPQDSAAFWHQDRHGTDARHAQAWPHARAATRSQVSKEKEHHDRKI